MFFKKEKNNRFFKHIVNNKTLYAPLGFSYYLVCFLQSQRVFLKKWKMIAKPLKDTKREQKRDPQEEQKQQD